MWYILAFLFAILTWDAFSWVLFISGLIFGSAIWWIWKGVKATNEREWEQWREQW